MKEIIDVRKTDRWAEYLKFLGWYNKKTTSGINIALRKLPIGTLVKIQRPQNLTQADINEIEEICKKEKALFVKIEPSQYQNVETLEKNGYNISFFPMVPTRTMFIDLTQPENVLWDNVSKSGKYSITRAKREGNYTEVYRNPSQEKLKEYFDIHLRTGKVKNFYIQPFNDLQKKAEIFKDDAILIHVYSKEGELLGGKFYLCDGPFVLYLHGGTSDLGRKRSKAGYALMWDSILYFKKSGFESIDLEGLDDERFPHTTTNWGGFSHFKEKFGGNVVEMPHPRVKYLSGWMKRIARFMPEGIGI